MRGGQVGGSSALQPLPGSAVCQELALRAFDRASNASQLSRRLQATSLASALLGTPFPCWTLATCPSPMSASPSPHIPSLHVPGPPAAGSPTGLPCTASVPSAVCRALLVSRPVPGQLCSQLAPALLRGWVCPGRLLGQRAGAQPSSQALRQSGPAMPPAPVQSAALGCGPSLGSSSKPDVLPSRGQPASLPHTWAVWTLMSCLGT